MRYRILQKVVSVHSAHFKQDVPKTKLSLDEDALGGDALEADGCDELTVDDLTGEGVALAGFNDELSALNLGCGVNLNSHDLLLHWLANGELVLPGALWGGCADDEFVAGLFDDKAESSGAGGDFVGWETHGGDHLAHTLGAVQFPAACESHCVFCVWCCR